MPKHSARAKLNLVVGLNQVDKIPPMDWDERLNLPSEEMERQIDRRCNDVIAKLAEQTGLQKEQVEYYSAKRRYRLMPLLANVIRHCNAGFRLDQVEPADPFELASTEAQEYATRKRQEMASSEKGAGPGRVLAELGKLLPAAEIAKVRALMDNERGKPPKVALFGKTGVGKTSTVNALVNAHFKVSHTLVGTTAAQVKEFEMAAGGSLTVVDLPGYGRTFREDQGYEPIYRDLVPSCDLVLLVLQANSRDFSDDQEMIGKLFGWMQASNA